MKKKFIAMLLVVSSIAVGSNLSSAKEVNYVRQEIAFNNKVTNSNSAVPFRESDWGDENYGNWKEIAEHPEQNARIIKCLGDKLLGLGIGITVEQALAKLAAGNIAFFGVAYFYLCMCLFS